MFCTLSRKELFNTPILFDETLCGCVIFVNLALGSGI